jgi:hypothetical protein
VRASLTIGLMSMFLAATAVCPAGAQERAFVRDPGPGRAGRLLTQVLERQHILLAPADTGRVQLRRGELHRTTVVVLGRSVAVASEVRGDVVVVGGDLFLHPGGHIRGRAIAFGGGVYDSHLAEVDGERISFRDITFDVTRVAEGYALDHRVTVVRVPARRSWLAGVRLPTYDRVNGLSLPYAYAAQLADGALEIEPRLTWRTHLGVVDPRLDARWSLTERTHLELMAARGTWTNDAWIFGDLANSLLALATGLDMRNYYRADRVYTGVRHELATRALTLEPRIGLQWERGWSVGHDSLSGSPSAPWSLFGRRSRTGMLRPNPRIDDGTIVSAIGRLAGRHDPGEAVTEFDLASECMSADGGSSVQIEADISHRRPGFAPAHEIRLDLHLLGTAGVAAPGQRYRALGGPGTLPFLDPLEQRGDQLVFVEAGYTVVLEAINLPFVGQPSVTARYLAGAAGVGGLPPLEHNAGVRIGVSLLRADLTTDLRRGGLRLSAGVSLGR